MRILHLAYEDPHQPGSGGGSVRTREINRRLAGRHEITALSAGYPGARAREEWGVRWVPLGGRGGVKGARLAYFALLAPEVARRRYDLVVEDFGAPFSVGFSPLFTRKPVVASVQWLFAAQMREKYRLPFDLIERQGLRCYRDFIAVSDWLARDLRAARPGAVVETIPNGVEAAAFATIAGPPRHLLFVGRLDIAQKGLDLLLEAFARAREGLGTRTPQLLIIGDGPDRAALARLAERLRLDDSVEFRGRVEGGDKYRLMASAHAVLMPSRFETFGMVAIEAQAAGAPVVAFDVGPLAEVAAGGGACLVPAFDCDTFAREIIGLVLDSARSERLRRAGRLWATRYDWDRIATAQEEHYRRAVLRGRRSGAGGYRLTPPA